jgi:hypothetical protein
MRQVKTPRKISVDKTERKKKKLRKLRHGWEDKIKMNIKEIGYGLG